MTDNDPPGAPYRPVLPAASRPLITTASKLPLIPTVPAEEIKLDPTNEDDAATAAADPAEGPVMSDDEMPARHEPRKSFINKMETPSHISTLNCPAVSKTSGKVIWKQASRTPGEFETTVRRKVSALPSDIEKAKKSQDSKALKKNLDNSFASAKDPAQDIADEPQAPKIPGNVMRKQASRIPGASETKLRRKVSAMPVEIEKAKTNAPKKLDTTACIMDQDQPAASENVMAAAEDIADESQEFKIPDSVLKTLASLIPAELENLTVKEKISVSPADFENTKENVSTDLDTTEIKMDQDSPSASETVTALDIVEDPQEARQSSNNSNSSDEDGGQVSELVQQMMSCGSVLEMEPMKLQFAEEVRKRYNSGI